MSKKRWLIKDSQSRILGPFETARIMEMIRIGELEGEELISLYPDQNWFPVSREPSFYDQLLKALSGSEEKGEPQTEDELIEDRAKSAVIDRVIREDSKGDIEVSARNVGTSENRDPSETDLGQTAENKKYTVRQGKKSKASEKPKKNRPSKRRDPASDSLSDIELVDLKKKTQEKILKKALRPILFGGVTLLLIFYIFSGEDEGHRGSLSLVAPRSGQASVSPEKNKTRIQRGLVFFLRDTVKNYQKAQNEFVQVLEGAPQEKESVALLCLSQFELWPFTPQRQKDLQVVREVTSWALDVDPGGVHAATCRAVLSLVEGNPSSAREILESTIDVEVSQGRPPILLYYLKAKLLHKPRELVSAIGYLESAQKLWPQWLRVIALEGQLRAKRGDTGGALKAYQRVLEMNPNHVIAQLESGILSFRKFQKSERAEAQILSALKIETYIPYRTKAEAFLVLAEISVSRGDSRRALEFAKKSYETSPQNQSAKNLLVRLGGVQSVSQARGASNQLLFEGDLMVREGDCNAAQALFKASFQADRTQARAAMKAGDCLWQLSFATDAIEWMNKAILADPSLATPYVKLADFYSQRFQFDSAAKILGSARSRLAGNHEIFKGFAIIELRRKSYQGAVNFAKKSIELYNADVESHLLLAEAFLKLQNPLEAYGAALKATKMDPNHREARVLLSKAMAGVQGLANALEHLEKYIDSYPQVLEYRIGRGELYLSDQQYRRAQKEFQDILNIQPKNKKVLLLLADSLKAQGEAKATAQALFQAAVLDPADPEPLFKVGELYLQGQRPQEALKQFQRVVKVNPKYPLVHYQMGLAALRMNQPEKALKEAEIEKRANPNLADAYLLAAEAHAQLGEFLNCGTQYQKAMSLRPQGAEILVKLARCYRQADNLDAAMVMLNQASKKESGYAEIYKELGFIYEKKGDLQRAVESYDQYLVLAPNAPDFLEVQGRLQSLGQ